MNEVPLSDLPQSNQRGPCRHKFHLKSLEAQLPFKRDGHCFVPEMKTANTDAEIPAAPLVLFLFGLIALVTPQQK